MSNAVVVHKGRTNVVIVKLGINVQADVFSSEIRSEPTQDATLLATWAVQFVTNGSDGQLKLTLDDLVTSQIKASNGFMDLKRQVGGAAGEPVPVFDRPLEVEFRGTVTE